MQSPARRNFEQVEQWLIDRRRTTAELRSSTHLSQPIARTRRGRIGRALRDRSSLGRRPTVARAATALVHTLTALPLPVTQHRGWNYAEVTAGGVPLKEIDYRTMESRKVPGLYLAGEILDCDGRIGGFNFQWAWATGYLAGSAGGGLSRRTIP